MEITRIGPALQEGVLEAVRNEAQRRSGEENQGELEMEPDDKGHPRQDGIEWNDWAALRSAMGAGEGTNSKRTEDIMNNSALGGCKNVEARGAI